MTTWTGAMNSLRLQTDPSDIPWTYQFGYVSVSDKAAVAVAVRFVLYAIMQGGWILSLVNAVSRNIEQYWMYYLTVWTLTIQCVYLLMSFVLTVMLRYGSGSGSCSKTATPFARGVMGFRAVSATASMAVTVLFWTLVYRPGMTVDVENLWIHAVNFLVTLLDLSLSYWQLPLAQVVYPVGYGAVYVLWSMLHYALGLGTISGDGALYPVLDWSKAGPTTVVVLVAGLVGLPLFHAILWGLTKLRNRILSQKRAAILQAHAERPDSGSCAV